MHFQNQKQRIAHTSTPASNVLCCFLWILGPVKINDPLTWHRKFRFEKSYPIYLCVEMLIVCVRVCVYSMCAFTFLHVRIWVKFILRRMGWGKPTENVRICPTQWAIETLFYFVLVEAKNSISTIYSYAHYYNTFTHAQNFQEDKNADT